MLGDDDRKKQRTPFSEVGPTSPSRYRKPKKKKKKKKKAQIKGRFLKF